MNKLVLSTIVLFLLLTGILQAQIPGSVLSEDEVPPNLIAKHFSQYSGSSTGTWYRDGSEYYISFVNAGKSSVAMYNKSGRLLKESVTTKGITPQQIESHLDQKFNKYKIVEFRAVRDLQNQMEYYEVDVKSKVTGLVTELYDRSLNPTDSPGMLARN